MPYLPQTQRDRLVFWDNADWSDWSRVTAGELIYLFTCEAIDLDLPHVGGWVLYDTLMSLAKRYIAAAPISDQRLTDVMGALTRAQFEYARRMKHTLLDSNFEGVKTDFYLNVVVPFENERMETNDDIYREMAAE